MHRLNLIQSDRDPVDDLGLIDGGDVGTGPHAVHNAAVTATDD